MSIRAAPRPWSALALLSLASASFAAGEGPALSQLTLAHALELLLSRDPTIAVQQAATSQAQADQITAAERPNATLAYSTSKIDTAGHNGPGSLWDKQFDTIVNLSQPFERGGKRKHRLAQATAAVDAAHADFADTLRTERLAISQAYWEIKRAQEKFANETSLATTERRALQAAEQRLKLGDAPRLDVERMRVAEAETENDLDTAQATLSDAQVTLAGMLDAAAQAADLSVADAWPKVVAYEGGGDERAIASRPDVLAAQRRVNAADAALDLAHAQRTRDVTISGEYEHNPTPFGHTLLGIGVSIPLFTGNGFEGEIRRANADLESAQAVLVRVRAAAAADIRRASTDLATSAQRAHRFDGDIIDRAQATEQAVETAFAHGAIGLADVLDARRSLKSLLDDATDAHADYAEALAAFAAATFTDEAMAAR